MTTHSQLAPMPVEVPFRLVSKTIGSGAYACIKKAIPADAPSPIFAVKFIHKAYAQKHGHLSLKQLNMEITLHNHLSGPDVPNPHPNIIRFFKAGDDPDWKWIAMELADGGDCFDKIESDVGVGEPVAHAYFHQLIGAVEFMHSRGVGHRDLKPENVLLNKDGNLKVADFGLATLFEHGGRRKSNKTSCGSPPYTAPEVVKCESRRAGSDTAYYFADQVDIWSCGVVLFVLLVGNTPWDEPSDQSYEFHEYVQTNGHPDDELFNRLPPMAYDLLRGILSVDPKKRLSIKDIKKHPWYTQANEYLKSDGSLANPVAVATSMFESMKIDFNQNPFAPSSQSQSHVASQRHKNLHSPSTAPPDDDDDAMQIDDSQPTRTNTAFTSRADADATPIAEITFDWERPATQQTSPPAPQGGSTTPPGSPPPSSKLRDTLADEPALSQFTPAPAVPLTRTQFARRFADILPAETLNQFYSTWSIRPLIRLLSRELASIGVPMTADPAAGLQGGEDMAVLHVRAKDGRGQRMKGEVVLQKMRGSEETFFHVVFVKANGDPVEWRRLFKRVVVLCKEAVYVQEEL